MRVSSLAALPHQTPLGLADQLAEHKFWKALVPKIWTQVTHLGRCMFRLELAAGRVAGGKWR